MPLTIFETVVPDGAINGLSNKGQILCGFQSGVANVAGGGAGASVTITVTGLKNLPANYVVVVNPGQAATYYVSSKTSTGFVITITPVLATTTLSVGTIDWALFG